MRKFITFAALFAATAVFTTVRSQEMSDLWGEAAPRQEPERRGRYFADGNYAMFIHWGLYSALGGVWDGKTYYGASEWIMEKGMAGINPDEYKALARGFDPQGFDARAIARLALDAGMKYIVITSKHHDGFAMFRSSDPFNIVDATPFGRDPMRELADACRELGLGFGFYYSHSQDWTHPGGRKAPRVDKDGNPKTFDDYFYEKCLPQVEEITTNYGDIEIIWFDTPGNLEKKYAEILHDVVRRNQPDALIASRIGHGLHDYVTLGDMEVPLENVEGLWEGIDVTNDSWGYNWYDTNWKTPETILRTLISTVARGGTFMLNVGPDGDGRVPEAARRSLLSAGRWIARYPEAVYGAGASPWGHALPWGDAVSDGNKLYLTVFEWPRTGELWIPGLRVPVRSARILGGDGQPLTWSASGNWTVLDVPFRRPDEMISVVELTFDQTPEADRTLAADPELGLEASVLFGTVASGEVDKHTWRGKFGEWKHTYRVTGWQPGTSVTWTLDVPRSGTYAVSLNYRGTGRPVWEATTGEGQTAHNQQGATEAYADYPLGWLEFHSPGRHTVTVTLVEGDGEAMSLAGITLEPVRF
ncbi:MAG: alpha-L-fucosidase [Alistipes sp.]|nr:alpha-L-fucosidase [Alistipes sp.]